jgi:hypothetical protein
MEISLHMSTLPKPVSAREMQIAHRRTGLLSLSQERGVIRMRVGVAMLGKCLLTKTSAACMVSKPCALFLKQRLRRTTLSHGLLRYTEAGALTCCLTEIISSCIEVPGVAMSAGLPWHVHCTPSTGRGPLMKWHSIESWSSSWGVVT